MYQDKGQWLKLPGVAVVFRWISIAPERRYKFPPEGELFLFFRSGCSQDIGSVRPTGLAQIPSSSFWFMIAIFGEIETVKKKNGIIQQAHINTGHGGEKKTYKEVCEQYGNIPRSIVSLYIVHCERCFEKLRRKETAAGVVVRPLSVRNLNERGQVDLVDMQTMKAGSYRFIHVIRLLKSKTAAEVANELLFIFLDIGAPHILQSDNGREFTAEVIQELASLWPELILVNGRPRHPRSQGSIERGNGDIKLKLMAWIRDNNCAKWSYGARFVQWAIS
ncbi:KRAB-A domain-containing protein 2-like [Macrobrachium nipponense]|uniref:KRAB-A domain-containing protein 2-like n=1 Tax=Macrobrachium nipponense TaxID=159736 RepID=UPI0030C7CF95